MFDFRHVIEPLLDSEQAEALVKMPRKALPQYSRNGSVAGLHTGNLWRFLTFDLGHCPPRAVNSEQLSVPPHHS
jgi:hypothetical protein